MLPPLNGWQHPTVHLLPKAGCEMGPHHHLHWHFLTVNKAGTPDVYVLFVFSSMKCLFLAFDLTSFQINFLKNLIFKNCIYLFWLSHTACGILVSRSEIDPGPLHWKRGVLTTGLPGKSLTVHFKDKNVWQKSSSFSSLQLFKNFLWIVSGTWGSGMNHLMRGRVFDEREEMCLEML